MLCDVYCVGAGHESLRRTFARSSGAQEDRREPITKLTRHRNAYE